MNYTFEINAGIGKLDKWKCVPIACMCAASVLPIVARFAQPITRQVFDQGLDAIWQSVRDKAADARVMSIRATLENLPESACDDSNVPSYEATVALGVLAHALDAVIQDESNSRVRDACALAANCYSGYDQVIARGDEPQKINPHNPPPPGRLELLQMQSQFRLVKGALESRSGLIEEAQTIAAQLASEMLSVLPIFVTKRGWERI